MKTVPLFSAVIPAAFRKDRSLGPKDVRSQMDCETQKSSTSSNHRFSKGDKKVSIHYGTYLYHKNSASANGADG